MCFRLDMLNTNIHSLGKKLALNLVSLPSTLRLAMLGNIVDSSGFAIVTLVGHSLDVYNITFLLHSHVCGQRNGSMLPNRPRELVMGSSPLSLCFCHFGQLLKDGGSGRSPNSLLGLILWYWINQDVLCWRLTKNTNYLLYSGFQTLVGFKVYSLYYSQLKSCYKNINHH